MAKIEAKKIVRVDWVDSAGSGTLWETLEDLDGIKPLRCTTVGFVLEDTDDHITLAMSTHEDRGIMGALAIPRVAVTRVKVLR